MHGAVTNVEHGTREMRADFIIEFAVTCTLDKRDLHPVVCFRNVL